MHSDKSHARPLALALLLAFAGCMGTTAWTRTGAPQRPRPANCDFQIFTASTDGYAEIGTIDYSYDSGLSSIKTLGEFKARIRPIVCEAGGDAAIAFANGLGEYAKATVLKATPDERDEPVSAAAPGCSYDTQCKGERICQQGVCVDPPAKP
jgi:hypothetical protein